MLKWGIFNASVLLNEYVHPHFTKFELKSIITFISEELP